MTNPDNAIGTNAAYGGRTSTDAFNDDLAAFSRGVVSGWNCSPDSGLTVALGGNGSTRDVAIAEDNSGNKTTINNISRDVVNVTMAAAPAANSRIDAVVAYVDNPANGTSTVADNPSACGIIPVSGTASVSPVVPTDNQIRTAITADGASGTTAYYVVLAYITIANGTTDIVAGDIEQGPSAATSNIASNSIDTNMIKNAAITAGKIDFSTIIETVGSATNYCLKYADGTMIACQQISGTATFSSWGGSVYSADKTDCPNFAQAFYATPTVSVTVISGYSMWLASNGTATTTKVPGYTLCRVNSASNQAYTINIIAIGRWKA